MPIGEGTGAVRVTDTSGNTLAIDTSGLIGINAGSITANVSGDVVNISGQVVNISGAVVNNSGSTVVAKVSGESVTLQSGSVTKIMGSSFGVADVLSVASDARAASTLSLNANAFLQIFRENGSGLGRARLTESGQTAPMSGIGFNLAVNFSGAVATISGNAITVSGNVTNVASSVIVPNWVQLTGASGGTSLGSGICYQVQVQNVSGNNVVLIGGNQSGTQAPVSGTKGVILYPGSVPPAVFKVNNINQLAGVAHTSGQFVTVFASAA